MNACVIADRDDLGSRIRQALLGAGQTCPPEAVVRLDQVQAYLARARPALLVAAAGRDPETIVTRLRALASGSLVVVGPISDPRAVLRVLRLGADDFVDEAELEADLPEALARLRTGGGGRATPGRLVAVIAPSGGSGASLIAANLAVALAKAHERCLLLDLKPRCGDLAALLDLKPSHTVQDLCRAAARLDRTLLEQSLARHATGVSLLASARGFEAGASGSAEGLERILELGRDLFPRIVADADPTLPSEAAATLRAADAVLVVMRLEFNSLRNARTMLDHLERQGVEPKRLLLIGNRKGQPKEIAPAKFEEALGRTFFAQIPDDPKAALGAQNNGVPVLKEAPSSWLAKGLTKLASALDDHLAAPPAPALAKGA